MASVVSICNLALTNIGKDSISAIDEASAEARACRRLFGQTLDVLLCAYPWTFARAASSLAPMANDRYGRWEYAYAKPADCLKIAGIRQEYSAHQDVENYSEISVLPELLEPYELGGQNVYCNLSPAILLYTRRVTDPTKFTPLFVEALSWQLSARIAMPLTRDPKTRSDAWQTAQAMKAAAIPADAGQERIFAPTLSPYDVARDQ
ncbi:MAG: hypothetical protein HC900_00300 [Methylacidiphilales bacterium]|nr:hypothetical protein [Candidatus Methylacidiphilales bacterium]